MPAARLPWAGFCFYEAPPALALAQMNGHFKLPNLAPGDYTVYAWDDPGGVEYANPDWMRRYGTGGVPISVTAGQNVQIKLTMQLAPPQ